MAIELNTILKMDNTKSNIFLDKMSLSAAILDKEGQLIGLHNDMILEFNIGTLSDEEIGRDTLALSVVRTLKDLYDILKNNKIKAIVTKNVKLKNDESNIIHLLDKFKTIKPDSKITFKDIDEAYSSLLMFVSKAGYHKDEAMSQSEADVRSIHW